MHEDESFAVTVGEQTYTVTLTADGQVRKVTTPVEEWNGRFHDRRIFDGYQRKPPGPIALTAIRAARELQRSGR